MLEKLRFYAKRVFFPGLDLHTRCRYRFLPKYFRSGLIDTLDAGCGNGALSYAAYKRGNRVLGITSDREQVRKAHGFFAALGTDQSFLQFDVCDLYQLPRLNRKFDQIICNETLEHIKQDKVVIQHFYDILRPNGLLHLCCPFASHPLHRLGRINDPENGGHVRDGYTLDSYKTLLESAGFKIIKNIGLGSPIIVLLDKPIRWVRNYWGDAVALPLFLLSWPLQIMDYLNPRVPFSLYVQAIKVSNNGPSA